MSAQTFAGHFLGPDIHANRPSATGLPDSVMYWCTTHHKFERIVSGAWADYSDASGGTDIATNSIWTAKGDILLASGSAAGAKLAVGANNKVLVADSSQTLGARWDYPGTLPINAQTGTTYTFALTDNGALVTLTNASAIAVTVPTNASVAFPTGASILCAQRGAGLVTVSAAGGVTVHSRIGLKAGGQYAYFTLVYIGSDVWDMSGDVAA